MGKGDDAITGPSVSNSASAGAGLPFAPPVRYDVNTLPTKAVFFDVDGDGDLDLAVPNSESGGSGTQDDSVSILLNNGDGTFAAGTESTVGDSPNNVVAGDLDSGR
ncbi:MAG: hypothetical protein Ct9H300mP1_15980 [Planctomycetaceae bacterium]|nr:MAG: hypothetical protein Ct9H300mP1_15980 [Planctomycetaceae bacterium]